MVKLTWLGHAAWEITGSKTVLVDPFLNDNPAAPKKAADITEADVVAVTHDHFDHMADAPDILKRTGATLVATYEVATYLSEKHGIKAEGGNIGGSITVDGVTCHMVQAWHTAGRGAPTGFVIEMDGRKIYHMADTGLFGDLALLGEIFQPDVLLVPIGDRFTMGPPSAARAVGMVKPKVAIPMHYNTWPPIEQDPNVWKELAAKEAPETEIVILGPGESYELK
ncbi:metal-dependent hydrolase [Planctomycetota bacterium]